MFHEGTHSLVLVFQGEILPTTDEALDGLITRSRVDLDQLRLIEAVLAGEIPSVTLQDGFVLSWVKS